MYFSGIRRRTERDMFRKVLLFTEFPSGHGRPTAVVAINLFQMRRHVGRDRPWQITFWAYHRKLVVVVSRARVKFKAGHNKIPPSLSKLRETSITGLIHPHSGTQPHEAMSDDVLR